MAAEELRAAVAALSVDALAEERWFGAKDGPVGPVELLGSLRAGGEVLLALRVGGDAYLVPAALRDGRIVEAEGPLWRALVAACLDGSTLAGDGLVLTGTAGPVPAPVAAEDVRPLGIDQSNTSVVLGGRTVLKCYRRVAPGGHPEIELTRWLSGRGLACLPAVHGSATASLGGGEPAGALLLQDFVADGRDGWLAAEAELGALLDAGDPEAAARAPEAWAPGVGRATAELHALLATAEEPAFAPCRATAADAEQLAAGAAAELDEALARVGGEAGAELAAAGACAPRPVCALRRGRAAAPDPRPRRPPPRPVPPARRRRALRSSTSRASRRRARRRGGGSPRRCATSPGCCARSTMRPTGSATRAARRPGRSPLAWLAAARGAIRSAYEQRLAELGAPFAVDPGLLAAFEAEKAAYEFVYAVRFLPAWLEVPRRALPSVLA